MKLSLYVKKWLTLYLFAQGIGGILWWCLLFSVPASRSFFLSDMLPDRVLISFWLPDLFIFILCSLMVAYGWRKNRGWVQPVLYFLTGGIAYASLYCLALSLSTRGGWLGTLIMLFCMFIMFYVCSVVRSSETHPGG
ncbi:hypothetical protein [Gimesia aquarii]|uniref:Uncharacterized protein n=1 Tax=Gimesia aquarii TaxID=2527964 RepID=A0A517W439_9PLAN|nr:hypothetical protein [Gimesia aquarii]QDU00020.1 hypothetical protein V144x_55330 [Gimesia aquarii]